MSRDTVCVEHVLQFEPVHVQFLESCSPGQAMCGQGHGPSDSSDHEIGRMVLLSFLFAVMGKYLVAYFTAPGPSGLNTPMMDGAVGRSQSTLGAVERWIDSVGSSVCTTKHSLQEGPLMAILPVALSELLRPIQDRRRESVRRHALKTRRVGRASP